MTCAKTAPSIVLAKLGYGGAIGPPLKGKWPYLSKNTNIIIEVFALAHECRVGPYPFHVSPNILRHMTALDLSVVK